jgi:hypothetical protein
VCHKRFDAGFEGHLVGRTAYIILAKAPSFGHWFHRRNGTKSHRRRIRQLVSSIAPILSILEMMALSLPPSVHIDHGGTKKQWSSPQNKLFNIVLIGIHLPEAVSSWGPVRIVRIVLL